MYCTSQQVKDYVLQNARDEINGVMHDVSTTIYGLSEIAFEERQSAAYLCDLLESAGFSVTRGYCGMPTSFRAETYGSRPGPTVALIAEYDALPTIGHACGHNLISSCTIGAAFALKSVIKDLPGRIVVIGAPAEESGGGKAFLVERGAFKDVDAAIIAHPSNRTFIAARALAWEPLRMKFYGKPAHAGSSPHEGVNALNAMIETFNSINALRQHVTGDVRVHGIITHGGDAVNVVPAFTQGDFLVRAGTVDHLKETVAKVKACANGAALSAGATVEFEQTGPVYEPVKGNRPLEEAMARNLEAVGVPYSMGGAEVNMGSTDVGNVSQVIPALHPLYEICGPEVVSHTVGFARASAGEFALECTRDMAVAMALTCVDLLCDAGLLERVKDAFAADVQ
jgi:amidohydrolase